MIGQCDCIRENGTRCRNDAYRTMRIFQDNTHSRVGPTRWFRIELCQPCFFASEAKAIVSFTGREKRRNL